MGKNVEAAKPVIADDLSQKLFVGTMLSMGWQMAIGVLVPTVGGYQLDAHLGTSPYLTLVGLLLSVIFTVIIIRKAIKDLNVIMMATPNKLKDNESTTATK